MDMIEAPEVLRQSQSRAYSNSSQPSSPEFQINVESVGPSSTLFYSRLNRAGAMVSKVGNLVEFRSKLSRPPDGEIEGCFMLLHYHYMSRVTQKGPLEYFLMQRFIFRFFF